MVTLSMRLFSNSKNYSKYEYNSVHHTYSFQYKFEQNTLLRVEHPTRYRCCKNHKDYLVNNKRALILLTGL